MPTVNPAYVALLKKTVKDSPFPSHMKMMLDDIDIDRAEVVITLAGCHLQPRGIVHGGVVATAIDTATFWAAFLRLPEADGLVNVDLKLNDLRPAVDGRLIAKGRCLRPGRTISYAEAKVYDDREQLVAHGTSTFTVLPGRGLPLSKRKFLDR